MYAKRTLGVQVKKILHMELDKVVLDRIDVPSW
jgi:hypothetical protein